MELALITGFIIKHFICDFPLQRPFHYLNKGKYGHPGGVYHASIHGVGTVAVLATSFPGSAPGAIVMGLLDAILHYHIDWGKVRLNQRYRLKADNSEWFWYLLGLDQLLHYLTYVSIIVIFN